MTLQQIILNRMMDGSIHDRFDSITRDNLHEGDTSYEPKMRDSHGETIDNFDVSLKRAYAVGQAQDEGEADAMMLQTILDAKKNPQAAKGFSKMFRGMIDELEPKYQKHNADIVMTFGEMDDEGLSSYGFDDHITNRKALDRYKTMLNAISPPEQE